MKTVAAIMCVLGIASVVLAEEMVENPAYKAWATFKPGSKVKMDMTSVTVAGDTKVTSRIVSTSTLKEVTAEKVVLEVVTEISMGDQKLPAQTMKQEIPAKVGKTTTQPANVAKMTEGDEEIEVVGKKYKAHWVETVIKAEGTTMTTKVWMVKEIPGGTARMESKSEGTVSAQMKAAVVEFGVAG